MVHSTSSISRFLQLIGRLVFFGLVSVMPFLTIFVYGQELAKIIPPSPEVSAFAKYGNIPVNLYTGVPNIEIPLYQVQQRDISVPISLSYHASGIKVNEEASWVGLGWVLNASGVISRTVVGEDDFMHTYLDPTIPNITDISTVVSNTGSPYIYFGCDVTVHGVNLCDYLARYPSGTQTIPADFEPDQFSFSYPGGSGKFILDRNGNAILQKTEKIKITYISAESKWEIKDATGYTYVFQEYETEREQGDSQEVVTAWHLTKITSPKGHSVVFSYDKDTDYNLFTIGDITETRSIAVSQSAFSGFTLPVLRTYKRVTLASIDFSTGYVRFNYDNSRTDLQGGKKLNSVQIFRKDPAGVVEQTPMREYTLGYDYFHGNSDNISFYPHVPSPGFLTDRLKLISVTERSQTEVLPPYLFEYIEANDLPGQGLPSKSSFAQDYWGYYNGNTGSSTLVPLLSTTLDFGMDGRHFFKHVSLDGQNRQVRPGFAKAFTLQKITYPTGGTTEFEFESHDYDASNSLIGPGEDPEPLNIEGRATKSFGATTNQTTLTPLDLSKGVVNAYGQTEVSVSVSLRCMGNPGCSDLSGLAYFVLVDENSSEIGGTAIHWQDAANCNGNYICDRTFTFHVNPGQYQVKAVWDPGVQNLMVFNVQYSFDYYNRPFIPFEPEGETSPLQTNTEMQIVNAYYGQTTITRLDLTDAYVHPVDGKARLSASFNFRCHHLEEGCQGVIANNYDAYFELHTNAEATNPYQGSYANPRVDFTDDTFCFNTNGICERGPFTYDLPPGVYYVKAHWDSDVDLMGMSATYSWEVVDGDAIGDDNGDGLAGGLRIASIVDNDGYGNNTVKKFIYNYKEDRDQNGTEELYSYGRLMDLPHFVRYELNYDWNLVRGGLQQSPQYTTFIQTASSNTPLAIHGITVGYDKVIELRCENANDQIGKFGKTVYQYHNRIQRVPYGDSRLPGIPNANVNSNGLLHIQTDYKYTGAQHVAAREIINSYAFDNFSFTDPPSTADFSKVVYGVKRRVIGYETYECEPGVPCPPLSGPGLVELYFYPASHSEWVRLLSTSEKMFDDVSTSYVETITNYEYETNPVHYQTKKIVTQTSGGETVSTEFTYPADPGSGALAVMWNENTSGYRHMHNQIIAKKVSRGTKIINRIVNSYGVVATTASGYDIIAPQLIERYPTDTEKVDMHLSYDGVGNVQSVQKEDDQKISYLWGYNNTFPIAQAVNAEPSQIAYASFERNDDRGQWSYPNPVYIDGLGKTGNRCLNGGVLTSNVLTGVFTVSLWAKDGIPQVNGVNATFTRAVNGWHYHEWTINMSGGVATVDANGAKIDDVRLFPENSQMTTYAYDPVIGVTAQTDPNNVITYYNHDLLGRLSSIVDEKGNTLKTFSYYYKGQE